MNTQTTIEHELAVFETANKWREIISSLEIHHREYKDETSLTRLDVYRRCFEDMKRIFPAIRVLEDSDEPLKAKIRAVAEKTPSMEELSSRKFLKKQIPKNETRKSILRGMMGASAKS